MRNVSIFLICLLIFSIGGIEKTELYVADERAVLEIIMDEEQDLTFVLDLESGEGYVDGAYDFGIDVTKYDQNGVFYLCSDGSYVYFVSDIDLKSVLGKTIPEINFDAEFLTSEKETFLDAEFFIEEEIEEINEFNLDLELSDDVRIQGKAVFTYENEIDINNATITIEKEKDTLLVDFNGEIETGTLGMELLAAPMLEMLLKTQYDLDVTIRSFKYENGHVSIDASSSIKKEKLEEYGEFLDLLNYGEFKITKIPGYYELGFDLTLDLDGFIEIMEGYAEEDTGVDVPSEEFVKHIGIIKDSRAKFKLNFDLNFEEKIYGYIEANCDNFDKYYKKAKEQNINIPLNKGKIDITVDEDFRSNIAVKYESESIVEIVGKLEDKFYIKGNIKLDPNDSKLLRNSGITYIAFDGKTLYVEFDDIETVKNLPLIESLFWGEPKYIEDFEHMEIKKVDVQKPKGIEDELKYLGFEEENEGILLILGILVFLLGIAAVYFFTKKREEGNYCKHCGFKLEKESKKCPNCGKEV